MVWKTTVLVAVIAVLTGAGAADDWPQWRGARRDGVWSEKGLVKAFPDKQVKVLWRAKIGPGYSGPTVADGRVYVTDRHDDGPTRERIHCFDAKTGKNIWTHSYLCPSRVGYPRGMTMRPSAPGGTAATSSESNSSAERRPSAAARR